MIQALAPTEKKPPIANKALLREQVAAVGPQLTECAKQASFSGSGSAVLTYMVTPNKQKQDVSIEQTGVEYDGTTIDNQPLLDCLKDTAKDMKFKYVADTNGVFAFRRVKFEVGIALEDIEGIRGRVTARGGDARNWLLGRSFHQLYGFLAYKAEDAGIPLVLVDPRDTSRTCSACGHCEKGNRRSPGGDLRVPFMRILGEHQLERRPELPGSGQS